MNLMTNKNFKLIALDVDGTLIRSDHVLTARTLRAIRNAKDVGIKVTIATGRHYKSSIRLAQKLQINAPLICSDGAIISDIYSNDTIYHFLPKKIAIDVLKMALDHKNLKIQVFTKDKRIFVGPNYRRVYLKRFLHFPFKYSLRGFYNLMRDFVFVPVKNVSNIKEAILAVEALDEAPVKMFIRGNKKPEELRKFEDRLITEYGDKITITSALENSFDILKGGISKAKGLSLLSDELGIRQEEVITVGDNFNDMQMIKYAGLGVAMGNAPDQVKAKADYVTASNNEDGLAKFLEKLLSGQVKTGGFSISKGKLCRNGKSRQVIGEI